MGGASAAEQLHEARFAAAAGVSLVVDGGKARTGRVALAKICSSFSSIA